MAERQVWIRAIALPQGSEQTSINVRVRDDYIEQTFVMEPEDVREMKDNSSLTETIKAKVLAAIAVADYEGIETAARRITAEIIDALPDRAALLDKFFEHRLTAVSVGQLLRAKVTQWHQNCSNYENDHKQRVTHYGCAAHLAECFQRGAKEAFSRVLNEIDTQKVSAVCSCGKWACESESPSVCGEQHKEHVREVTYERDDCLP